MLDIGYRCRNRVRNDADELRTTKRLRLRYSIPVHRSFRSESGIKKPGTPDGKEGETRTLDTIYIERSVCKFRCTKKLRYDIRYPSHMPGIILSGIHSEGKIEDTSDNYGNGHCGIGACYPPLCPYLEQPFVSDLSVERIPIFQNRVVQWCVSEVLYTAKEGWSWQWSYPLCWGPRLLVRLSRTRQNLLTFFCRFLRVPKTLIPKEGLWSCVYGNA